MMKPYHYTGPAIIDPERCMPCDMPDDIDKAFAAVTIVTGVPRAQIVSPSRIGSALLARHIFVKLARDMGYTQNMVGTFINRDHSTVVNSQKKLDGFMETEKTTRHTVAVIENLLKRTWE